MTILESLEIARNGCYLYAHTLEIESKKRVCKSRSKQDKIEMKECAKTYNEAADRIHPVIKTGYAAIADNCYYEVGN